MNTPNKLTMMRVVLIPFFAVALLWGGYFTALLIFVVASITDMLDGYLARRDNLITDFGILMDPLADKLLVMAALICLVGLQYIHSLVAIIILGREFLVTSIRLVAAGKGEIIAADKLGKIKTVLQMVWLSLLMLAICLDRYLGGMMSNILYPLCNGLMIATVVVTLLSGANYVKNNISIFKDM